MSYTYLTQYSSPNYHGSRDTKTEICIHHWGSDGQSFNGVVNWLCNPRAKSSAHFVAEAGRVACLVNMDRIAWHAGPGNRGRVGIECRPEMSSGDLETVAELVALIWHWCPATKGRRLRYHSQFMNTACPGRWKNKLEWLRQRANHYYPLIDPKRPGTLKGKPAASQPAPAQPVSSELAVDGNAGPATIGRAQQIARTTVDRKITGQALANKKFHVRIYAISYGSGGSELVRAIQRALGNVSVDGHLGPQTIKAMQARLGVGRDGYFGPKTTAAWQRKLNAGKLI